MNYDEVLLSGDKEALWHYINDTSKALVVDHREEEETILACVQKLIPEAALEYGWTEDGNDLFVSYKGIHSPLGLTFTPKDRYITLRRLNEILQGEYEIRVFKMSLGSDTHSFYIKPKPWWDQMESLFPEQITKLFGGVTPEMDF